MDFSAFKKHAILSLISKRLENGSWMNDPAMTYSALETLIEDAHGPKPICRSSLLYGLNKRRDFSPKSENPVGLWGFSYEMHPVEDKVTKAMTEAIGAGYTNIMQNLHVNQMQTTRNERQDWLGCKQLHIIAPADFDTRLAFDINRIAFSPDNLPPEEPWLIAYRGRLDLHWDHPYDSATEDKSHVTEYIKVLMDLIKKDHWESTAVSPEETTAIVISFVYDLCAEFLMTELKQGRNLKESRELIVRWLLEKQGSQGAWINSPHITSHALRAIVTLLDNPYISERLRINLNNALGRGISYLLAPEIVAQWDNLQSYQDIDILGTLIRVSKFRYMEKQFLHDLKIQSEGIGPNIFISFGYCDEDFAMRLANDLAERGIHLWFAEFDIDYGENFLRKIENGMKSTRTFVVVLTPEGIKRKGVQLELELALDQNKEIIPLLYKACHPPEAIEKLNWIDFTNPEEYERNIENLVRRLKGRLRDRKNI